MTKKHDDLAKRRERLPEIGGILHLEHVNFEVADHEMPTIFFMNGLGLTRDPYRRADETNMGVNIGMQQFHLPRRGKETPPFTGEIGLVVPDVRTIKARLDRLKKMGKFKGTPYAWKAEGKTAVVTSPFGVRMRLHRAGSIPFRWPLGLAYVDIPVPPGLTAAIANFYRRMMDAPVRMAKLAGEKAAVVTFGPHQYVRFRERKLKDYNLYQHHIAFYVTRYNALRDAVAEQGSLLGNGLGQVFFFDDIFDPDTGDTILKFQHEARSVYHEDFMRPLVNRWPIISEPYRDQFDIQLALADIPGLAPAGGAKA